MSIEQKSNLITRGLEQEFRDARTQRTASSGQGALQPVSAPRSVTIHPREFESRRGSNVQNVAPAIQDPRLNWDQFYLPAYSSLGGEPVSVLNQWIEHYYKFHPLVGNAIEIHSQLPISRFGLQGVDDPQVMQVYETMIDDLNLLENSYSYLKCWWLFGEVMPYYWWSDSFGRFVDMTFIDTSKLWVRGHYLTHSSLGDDTVVYELEPDEILRVIAQSTDPYDIQIQEFIDPEILFAVRNNLHVELDTFSTELVANKAMPWDIRGTSMILGVIKDLIYYDKLRMAQTAIAEGYTTPKWLWKLGTPGADGYMPTDDDLDAFRDLLISAHSDPTFQIVTHYAVNVDVIGANGKILPITQEMDAIDKRIMTRLFTNKSLTTGEGPNYATASVAMRSLMSRYLYQRSMMEDHYRRKLFLPVALANGFMKRKKASIHGKGPMIISNSEAEPIIPSINWRHKQSLLDDSSIRNSLMQLRDRGDVPLKIIADAFDLDYGEMLHWLDKEQGTLADRHLVEARKTFLSRIAQGASDGFDKVVKMLKATFLPKDKDDLDTEEKEPAKPADESMPEGFEPGALNKGTTEDGGTGDSTSDDLEATERSKPKLVKKDTPDPLGGEVGERVLTNTPGEASGKSQYSPGPSTSWRDRGSRRRARRAGSAAMRVMDHKHRSAALEDDDDVSLNQWQHRLMLSKMDRESQRDVIGAENHVLNTFDRGLPVFLESVLNQWRRADGSIRINDLEHALREGLTFVSDTSEDHMQDSLRSLWDRSQSQARNKLKRSKTGRKYYHRRISAVSDEAERQRSEAIDGALQRVTTVSSEVLEKVRRQLHDNFNDIPQNIVNALFAEVDAKELAEQGVSEEELVSRLSDLWNKQRNIYQRIVRTETMNIYSKSSLQEWNDAGFKKVVRREMHDHKVCAYCRSVDGKEYNIEDVLKLDYPLIQNPETGEYEGHPNCRGGFDPVVGMEDWDEFIAPPGAEFDEVVDLPLVSGVPGGLADDISKTLQDNPLETEVRVTPDVVDTREWEDMERAKVIQELTDKSGGTTPSDMLVDMELEERRENQRGEISSYRLDNGDTLVSGFSMYEESPGWFVLRQRGATLWSSASSELRGMVTAMFNARKQINSMTLEVDGLEIIGSPGEETTGFFIPAAAVSPEAYFAESYALYYTDAYKLEFLDPEIYRVVKEV